MSYGHLAVDYHERIKKLVIEDFWKNNTFVSPNQRDVVRRRLGSQNRDPLVKHFLDSTQTQFFAKFISMYPQI